MTSSAVIWSGALQSAATLLAGVAGARWGIDQPGGDAAWGGSAAGTARRVVSLPPTSSWSYPTIARRVSPRPRKPPGDGWIANASSMPLRRRHVVAIEEPDPEELARDLETLRLRGSGGGRLIKTGHGATEV